MALFNWNPERKLYAACGCHRGFRRSNNEDNFYFAGQYLDPDNDGLAEELTYSCSLSDDMDQPGIFFGVFDGMGGAQYGEVASNVAASCADIFFREPENVCKFDVTESITQMCTELNDAVFEESVDRGVSQMGSTLVGCYFYAGHVWACNMGDSRSFRLRGGLLQQISTDHTDAEIMKMSGITGRKPYVTQYLGIDRRELRISPAVRRDTVRAGDIYLICSDGLTDMVSEDVITEILMQDYEEEYMSLVSEGIVKDSIYDKNSIIAALQVKSLKSKALQNGGRDNVTIIVCSIVDE